MTFEQALTQAKNDLVENYESYIKFSKHGKLAPVPRSTVTKKALTAAQIERELRTSGFKPTDTQTKRRLKASGNWGMPSE